MKMPLIWIVVAAGVVNLTLLERRILPVTAAQEVHAQSLSSGPLEQQILSAERDGLDALKTGDLDRFGSLTADEAVLVDAHGPADKAQVMKNVAGFRLTGYSIDNVKFVAVAADTGLISYKISEQGSSHGREFAAEAYVSSLWTKRDGKWVCLFSQETAVPKPHPAG